MEVDPNVTASAQPEQTQDSPVSGQLQAPAAQPAQQPMQLQPSKPAESVTTPAVAPSPNQGLHGFISSVLSGVSKTLAGRGPTKYTTDASGKVIKDPNQPADTTGDRLRRIASNALTGLAAGSRAGGQKSGLANALSGIGAGAEAQGGKAQAQDSQAKKEARENEEAAQQKMVRMHEIARGNALTASTWEHMTNEEQDRDPHRLQSLGWAKAAEDAGVPVKYVTESEAQQLRQSDPEALGKYQVLPVGTKMVTDEGGNPILDDAGRPKTEAQFALIDGLHDGNIPAPQSFVDDLKKYGKYAGVTGEDNLQSGEALSMQHFIKLANSIQEGKKKEMQGWDKPQIGWKGDQPVQINSVTAEIRDFPAGVTPNVENLPEDKKAKKIQVEADTKLAEAKTKEALTNAALTAQQLSSGGGDPKQAVPAYIDAIKNLPPQAQAVLKAVSPDVQGALLTVASGDADLYKTFTNNPRKNVGGLSTSKALNLLKILNPNFNTQLYSNKQKLSNDFLTGKEGQGIRSFGQFLMHADEARAMSAQLERTQSPWLNKTLNELKSGGLGDPAVNNLFTAIMAGRSEWNTFIHNGHAPTKDEVDAGAMIMSDASSPRQILGAFGVMGNQAVGRLDQINETWKTATGVNYPNLIPPKAKLAAQNLGLGNLVKEYGSGGTLQGVMTNPQSGQIPQGAVSATAPNGHKIYTTDGGKSWMDSQTNKPFTQPAAPAAQ